MESDVSQSSSSSVARLRNSTPSLCPAKKQITVENQLENEFFNSVKKKLEEREQREKVYMEDPDRLFMLSLVDDLKQVPAHLKMSVKSKIMQDISNGLQVQKPPPLVFDHRP